MNDKVWFPSSMSSILFLCPVAIPCVFPLSSPYSCYPYAEHSPVSGAARVLDSKSRSWGSSLSLCTPGSTLWAVQPGSAQWRWGIFWALPLPSNLGWPRPSSLFVLRGLSRTALGRPRGAGAMSRPRRGCNSLTRLWFPKGTRQIPEP